MKSIPVSILCHTTGAIPLSSALKCHCMSPFAGTDSSISSTLISHEINGSEQVHLSSAQSRPSPCGCGGLEMPLQQEELLLCCSHYWHPQLQDKTGGFTSFLKELVPAGAARGPVQQEVTHGQGNLLPRSTASLETSPSGRASLGQPKGCVLV